MAIDLTDAGIARRESIDHGTLAGLDELDTPNGAPRSTINAQRMWAQAWPRLAALVLALGLWQLVVLSGWRPEYVLPPPRAVAGALGELLGDATFYRALAVTMGRAITGFALALVIGGMIGCAVAQSTILRRAVGSLITGLQTMPSIAWFPLAILLFQLSEGAITFVVVLGAAPSIANGIIGGVDTVPPVVRDAAHVLGARGCTLLRSVILPAAMPSILAGLKQGWAFAWRSLVAGELLVILADRPSLGARLDFARQFSDAPGVLAMMTVFLAIGLIVDGAFNCLDRRVRRRRGLLGAR